MQNSSSNLCGAVGVQNCEQLNHLFVPSLHTTLTHSCSAGAAMPHDQCPEHGPSNWWRGDGDHCGPHSEDRLSCSPRTSRRPPESNGNTAASL